MTAFLSWVDFSSAERERMRRAIQLFEEPGTVDEIGIGTIRDAFSDFLFPGTSTLVTRIRYYLFIPWIYQELERRRTSAADVARVARARELELVEPLIASEDGEGTLGRIAGNKLKRLPSSVYWAGLARWGILRFQGSQEQYHQAFDRLRAVRHEVLRPDDDGVTVESGATWHERLPGPPPGFPKEVSFTLTFEEADYLLGRVVTHCRGSLLAFLAAQGHPSHVEFPWQHPDVEQAPAELRQVVDLARRFSLVVQGAALLYNLMLSEVAGADERVEQYREALAEWASGPESGDLKAFPVEALWRFVEREHASVPFPTRRFVEEWVGRIDAVSPAGVADDELARRIVEHRERALKGSRSRFTNRRALNEWTGASMVDRLAFRWFRVQQLLNDLHAGLGREEVQA